MTFEEAKKELESYKGIERTIDQRRKWIRERKETVSKVTSTITDEPKGMRKHQDTMAENLSTVLDIESDTEVKIRELEVRKKVIYNKIMKIEQPYQDTLFNFYIMGLTTDSTALSIGYSKPHTCRMKDKAIEMYAKL